MSDQAYFLAIDSITITRGGVQRTFRRGDELVDVPDGSLQPMIRLGQAVAERPAVETVVDPPGDVADDWRATPIESLNINKNAKAAFAEAGLITVADALKFGAENSGLQSINGIGKASEEEFQAAVLAIQPKENVSNA